MHRDARLTPTGRRIMIEPIAAGPPQAHVAQQTSVSRRRCRSGGDARSPKATRVSRIGPRNRIDHRPARRNGSKNGCVGCVGRSVRGPPTVAMHTGGPASTVHKILVRPDLDRLARTDRPTGRVVRRCERARPGEPIHPDVGKVAGIPPGGGPRPRPGRERPGRLHVPALRGRRPLAGGPCRSPRRPTSRNAGRVPVSGPGPVPGPRHDRRRRDGGQRIELRGRPFRRRVGRTGNPAPPYRPVPAPIQRQGRAVQPDHRRRAPPLVHVAIGQRTTTTPRPRGPRPQPSPQPHHRRRTTSLTRPQRLWLLHLERRRGFDTRSGTRPWAAGPQRRPAPLLPT